MVKIQLATGYLDVKEGTAFPLNFQVGDIRDVSQRKGNFSKTITLTGSKNNNNLLNHYYDVNIIEGTFNINALTTCAVIQDGLPIMEDCSLQLTGVVKSQLTDGHEEHVTYEVLVKDSKADFFTAITNKELTDISFSDLNHTYDAFNVVNRFSNTVANGFKYFLPGSGDAIYSIQEFKPAIFAKIYFDRIFQDAGFTYDWPTLSVYDRFDKLIIPYNGGVDNFDYNDYLVKAEKTTVTTLLGSNFGAGITALLPTQFFTGYTELEDVQNTFNPITGVYTTPFNISTLNGQSYDYNVVISYSLELVNSTLGTLFSGDSTGAARPAFYRPRVSVQATGQLEIFGNLFTNTSPPAGSTVANNAIQAPLTLPVGSTTIINQTAQITLALSYAQLNQLSTARLGFRVDQPIPPLPGQQTSQVYWRTGSTGGTNSLGVKLNAKINSIQLSILPSSNIVAIGGTIEMNDYVPKKVKQSDFIKSIFNMYNIYAQVDSTQPNKLNLMHRDDFYDSGAEVDWTYKLAKDDEQELSFLPEITSKKLILTYAPDKDNPNTVYTDATSNIYGQAEVVFDNEYVKDINTKALMFSPTPVIKTVFGAFVPMIAGAAPQTNLRILYDKTTAGQPLATCGQFNIFDYGSVGQTNLTSYPLVGHFDDPLTPTFDINYAICDFYYYQPTTLTQNNLYNRYWRRTMAQINNGKMLTALFDLKEPDIQRLKLNDKIRIDNSWWNINKVIDYDANSSKLTKVELISIDSEINFSPFMNANGPITPSTPPSLPAIGPMQMLAMSNVNTTRMITTNVFSNNATAMVMGRGNVVIGGTRSMIVGDGNIVSEDEIITNALRTPIFNNVPTGITPRIYIANLSQLATLPPGADVMNNSFGGITWTRTGVGTYEGNIDDYVLGYIQPAEISVIINNVNFDGIVSATYTVGSNTISITTSQIGVGFADSYLNSNTIEIKYYEP